MGGKGIIGWLTNVFKSIGGSIRENVRTIGGAFCGLFVSSIVVCFAVALWYGDDWDLQRPVGTIADISGASFAIAIVILSVGRVAMVMARIFKRKEKEEGRREAESEFIEADAQRKPDETLQQAVERLRREKAKNG